MGMRAIMTGLVLAAGMAGAPAMAQDPAQVIAFLDKNSDNKIDLNEYLAFQVPKIAKFDENGDGELSQAEFKNSLEGQGKKNAAQSFKIFNSEGGRTLTQREFLGYHAFIFKTYVDTNKDGFMSAEEWSKIMAQAG